MNAQLPTTGSTVVPCTCGQFIFVDGNANETRLPCGGTTKRTFAPGHDARLKGALIKAGVAGHMVKWGDQKFEPVVVADKFGFGHMVRAGIELALGKEAEKAERKAAKLAAKADATVAEPEAELDATEDADPAEVKPVKVRFKIGRNEFEGELQLDAKTIKYTNAAGEAKEIAKGYKIIDTI